MDVYDNDNLVIDSLTLMDFRNTDIIFPLEKNYYEDQNTVNYIEIGDKNDYVKDNVYDRYLKIINVLHLVKNLNSNHIVREYNSNVRIVSNDYLDYKINKKLIIVVNIIR